MLSTKAATASLRVIAVLFLTGAAASAQIRYSVTEVCPADSYTPNIRFFINERGQITGTYYTPTRQDDAFLYSDGKFTDLNPSSGLQSQAEGINGSGQVVLQAFNSFESHPLLYSAGILTDLGKLTTVDPKGPLTGVDGINNGGQVVGIGPHYRGLLFSAGALTDLGALGGSASTPLAINSTGQIVGRAAVSQQDAAGNDYSHAFVFDGVIHDLGTMGANDSTAVAINDKGQIVGSYFDDDPYRPPSPTHAFLYDHGTMTALGSLGGPQSGADAINNLGQIVGGTSTGAFIYQNGIMQDLNTMIDPSLGFVLDDGAAINNAAWIVATGVIPRIRQDEVLLLTPIPETTFPGASVVVSVALPRRRAAARIFRHAADVNRA